MIMVHVNLPGCIWYLPAIFRWSPKSPIQRQNIGIRWSMGYRFLLPTMGTHCSFIFRGSNPYIWGVKPSFFMVLGSKGMFFGILKGVRNPPIFPHWWTPIDPAVSDLQGEKVQSTVGIQGGRCFHKNDGQTPTEIYYKHLSQRFEKQNRKQCLEYFNHIKTIKGSATS